MINDKYLRSCYEKNDISALRNAFSYSLDNDPSFELFRHDYEECKSVLLEPHVELTPFEEQSSGKWSDERYWAILNSDLKKNFSQKRFEHMMQVARIFYADKLASMKGARGAAAGAPSVIPDNKNMPESRTAPSQTGYSTGAGSSNTVNSKNLNPPQSENRRSIPSYTEAPRETAEEKNRREVRKRLITGLAVAAFLIAVIVLIVVIAG